MYTATERWMLDKNGKLCRPGDPNTKSLLVAQGGELQDDVAVHYGLPGAKIKGAPEPAKVEKAEESLPLDPAPAGVVAPTVPTAPEGKPDHGFPTDLKFGGGDSAKAQESVPAAPPTAPPVVTQPVVPSEQEKAATHDPTAPAPVKIEGPDAELPADFPHRQLLGGHNLGTVHSILGTTREQLVELDQIGSARADQIMAAREKLKPAEQGQ